MMTIFGYSPAQARKTLTAAIFAVAAVVGLFVTVDPNLTQALVVLGGAALSVVVVFGTKNHSWDDVGKAVNQLEVAGFTAAGYFVTVPATTTEKIVAATGAVLSAASVLFVPNAPGKGPAA
jgi:hypothetical protein